MCGGGDHVRMLAHGSSLSLSHLLHLVAWRVNFFYLRRAKNRSGNEDHVAEYKASTWRISG